MARSCYGFVAKKLSRFPVGTRAGQLRRRGSDESDTFLARRAVAKSFTLTVPHACARIRARLLSGWGIKLHS
jgi:phage-related protein